MDHGLNAPNNAGAAPVRHTIWDRLGASLGIWTVLWIGLHYLVLLQGTAQPTMEDEAYTRTLLEERIVWEWVTFLRILTGLVFLWFMGSLRERLWSAEKGSGRLSGIAATTGAVWGVIWLLSALFNSASILLVAEYDHATGSRALGMLAIEILAILTAPVLFSLILAVAYITLRFGGYPRWYGYTTAATAALFLVLAILQWYGPGDLNIIIMAAGLTWIAMTSTLTIPTKATPAPETPEDPS